ncbi:MAG TPA: hypothetical protein DCZ12_04130 [Gammaproteobacteria bacterium]|nr:hypothetical protein [Gammaproteobacteria bacterium]
MPTTGRTQHSSVRSRVTSRCGTDDGCQCSNCKPTPPAEQNEDGGLLESIVQPVVEPIAEPLTDTQENGPWPY